MRSSAGKALSAKRRVMSLRQDRRGTLWIGTMDSGLKKLTPDGTLESIPVASRRCRARLSAAGVMAIAESRSGAIWIGTFGGGANVLDPGHADRSAACRSARAYRAPSARRS